MTRYNKKTHSKKSRPQRPVASLNGNIEIEEIIIEKGDIINITADMIIGDVVVAYPETLPILQKIGIHCVGCYASTFESIQEGVLRHGIDPQKVCKMLNDTIHDVRRNSSSSKSRKR